MRKLVNAMPLINMNNVEVRSHFVDCMAILPVLTLRVLITFENPATILTEICLTLRV